MKRRLAALGMAFCMVFTGSGMTTLAQQTKQEQPAMESGEEAGTVSLLQTGQEERSILFNEDWSFILGDPQGAQDKAFDDSSWRKLDLPHDWSIEFDFDYSSPATSECGYLNGGTGWYRKTFVLPEDMKDKQVVLDFGGVYMNSTTYVNGTSVGTYPYGYMPFNYDITDQLVCDGKTENVIAVKVVNQLPSSRWYSGSGIYRDVHLVVTDKVHVGTWGTQVTTPEIQNGSGKVHAVTEVKNDTGQSQKVQVRQTVLDAQKQAASDPVVSGEVTVAAGGTSSVEQDAQVANPALWSTDSPNLYYLKTEVVQGSMVLDTYEARFGFRYYEFTTDNGFYLNGEWMKLYGVCMHHDQGSLGSAANETAIERQMQIMKDMGVNAIRVTHNPADEKLLEICDRLGLMVIEEAFDTWNESKKTYDYGRYFSKAAVHPDAKPGQTWAEFDIKNMVRRDRNAPSVIMWSIGNEIWMSSSAAGVNIAKNLVKWVKEMDSTRLTTIGEDKFRGDTENTEANLGNANLVGTFETVDIKGLNYAENRYDAQHEAKPDWKFYGSEIASATSSRGVYAHPDAVVHMTNGTDVQYQQSSYDTNCVGWGRTAMDSLVRDRDRKFIAGEFVWTGFDYIGEPTPWNQSTTTPPKSSYFGIVDTAGLPKDSYYLYQSQWTTVEENPMVHILPHWNWEDQEIFDKAKDSSGKIPVRVYTNGRSADLYFKPASDKGDGIGTIVESRKTFEVKTPYKNDADAKDNQDKEYQESSEGNLYLEWRMSYEPGTLTAISYDKTGNEIARDVVATAGEESAVSLKPETQVIEADGTDICYVEVDIADENGNIAPTADNEVYFQVSGNGKIVGVDNGNAASHERYKDTDGIWKRKAFSGKAMVLVQSTKEAGSFTLTAASDGLTSDTVQIYTTDSDTSDGDILGYQVKPVTTALNENPKLPASINAVYGNGSVKELKVTWEAIPEEKLGQEGTFQVTGNVENGEKVKISVTVIGILGIREITMVTPVGSIPELPSSVELYFTDGSKKTAAVAWGKIEQEQVDKAGVIEVEGTVEGAGEYKAKASIRVTDEVAYDRNIAARVGSALYPKPSASYNNVDDYTTNHENNFSSNFNDGNIARTPSWNNWVDGVGDAKDSWIQLEFENQETFGGVGIHFYTDGQTRKPAAVVIQTSADGQNWTPVKNQSQTDGFGDVSEDWATEFPISFSPVTAKYIRICMEGQKTEDGSNYKPVGVSELLVYAPGNQAPSSDTALLSDLKADGATVDGFAQAQYVYTLQVSYPYTLPVITAEAQDHASVFVIPAMDVDGAARILVRSESGTQEKVYTVNFEKVPLKLDRAVVQLEKTTLKENETGAISVSAYLEDGTQVDEKLLSATYNVKSTDGGRAEIVKGRLNALKAGTVTITASVTYQGETIASEPLTVTIEKGQSVVAASYDPVTVTTKPGVAPELPDTVLAHVEGSFDRGMDVTWDQIPAEQYADYGTFEVKGTVEGQELRPTAQVEVKEAVAAAGIAAVTAMGVIPDLPKTTTVYYSDGTSVADVPVEWAAMEQTLFDVAEGTVVTVKGTAAAQDASVEVIAKVRVTSQDAVKSENYYQLRNGYELPFAVASYTNDGTGSTDRVYKLNDAKISFAQTDAEGKNIWCNWVKSADRPTDWVGVIMAKEGDVVERFADMLSVGFFKEANSSGIQYPTQYQVQYYTGPLDFEIPSFLENDNPRGNIGGLQNHPFNNEANWTEVTYTDEAGQVQDTAPQIQNDQMTDIHFKPVKSCIVRVKMTSAANNAFGITEIEAYGKRVEAKDSYQMGGIYLDGTALSGFQADKYEYRIPVSAGRLPEITAQADHNASVTVIPANSANPTAKVIVLAENGMPDTQKIYTIEFESDTTVDRTGLEKALSDAAALHEGDYTPASYAVLKSAVDAGNKLPITATQQQVTDTAEKIRTAIKALMRKADMTALNQAVSDAEKILGASGQYTPNSIQGLAAAVEAAKKLAQNKDALQTDVDSEVQSLKTASGKALLKADKKALSELIQTLGKKDLSPYTPESAVALKNKLAEARQMEANANLSVNDQKQVTDMCSALKAAESGLKKIVVQPKPGKVTRVKVSSIKENSFKVSWKKTTGAASYKVSVYRNKTRKWSVAGTTSRTSFVVKKLKAGEKYSVRVTASNKAGAGTASTYVKTAAKPAKAKLTSYRKSGSTFRLNYKKQACTGYVLYERAAGKKKYTKLPAKKSPSFVRRSRKKGVSYYYKVRAYVKNGGKTVWGNYSKVKKLRR